MLQENISSPIHVESDKCIEQGLQSKKNSCMTSRLDLSTPKIRIQHTKSPGYESCDDKYTVLFYHLNGLI